MKSMPATAAASPPMATGSWLVPAALLVCSAEGASVVVAEVAVAASASLLEEPDSPLADELGASVVEAPADSESVADGDSVAESVAVSPPVGLALASLLKEDWTELT
jgi:hypothetical protein